MSNLSYHQPRVPIPPSRLLLRTISGHKSYVTSVSFFGPQYDRIITGSYDEVSKVRVSHDAALGACGNYSVEYGLRTYLYILLVIRWREHPAHSTQLHSNRSFLHLRGMILVYQVARYVRTRFPFTMWLT